MLLAIDVGNTNIAFGIYDNGGWVNHWRIRTVPDQMPDEYTVLFRELFCDCDIAIGDLERAVVSSVVPPVTDALTRMLHAQMGHEPLVIGPEVHTGIRIRTDNPAEVGSDLVANAVAAYDQFHCNCVVVDFGTALTFTAVAKPGDLLGVAIAPGLNAAATSLSTKTAQLPRVQLTPPPTAIGRNTTHSIQSGVVFGYIGLIEALIGRMKEEMGGEALAVATGGQARILAPLSTAFAAIEPWLTLDGLRIIAGRNA
jgi:type III pantothenate kinase